MEYNILFSNILTHVGVLAVFLTLFFFTFAIMVEKSIVAKQISFIVEVIINNVFTGIKQENKDKILDKINTAFDNLDLTEADKEVEESNNKIFIKSIKFIGIIIFIVLVLLIIIAYLNKWTFNHIFLLSFGAFITLLFVAITETSFLLLIASNYLSADPNKIREKTIDNLFLNRK